MKPRSDDIAIAPRPSVPTVAEARRRLAAEFRAGGFETPDLDARVLVAHALSLDHAGLIASGDRRLKPEEERAIEALAARRLAFEPVARILGRKEFWGLDLQLSAATLVPRPETETVIEAALARTGAGGLRQRPLRLLDLGTGSGAILLALLSELQSATGIGTDLSEEALRTAQDNARRFGMAERARFVCCDMAAALRSRFDLIVSNPPYIATAEIVRLPAEVRDFDPHRALDGGADGLDCYRAVAASAAALLAPEGALVVELGAGQADDVAALFVGAGLAPRELRADLSGTVRALLATKPV